MTLLMHGGLMFYERALKRRAVELARRADAWNDYCHLWREREKHFLEKEVEAYRQMTHQQNDQFNGGDDQDSNEDTDLMETSRVYEDVVADIVKEEEPEKTIAIIGEEKSLEIEADDTLDSRAYDVPQTQRVVKGLAMDNERTKLDPEVEWLRERLRVVQEGREKLNLSIDNREKESLQLQLLEDIAHQLQEIRMLTEPKTARQASLSLPSSKAFSQMANTMHTQKRERAGLS
ncbi:hypothetical protein Tco_1171471 [Tanacetum coccineum]